MHWFNILVIDNDNRKVDIKVKKIFDSHSLFHNLPFDFIYTYKSSFPEVKEQLEKENIFDLIILFSGVPQIPKQKSGTYNILRYIKENHPNLPVLQYASGNRLEDTVRENFEPEYQPDIYLQKSESPEAGDFELLHEKMLFLLKKFGKIQVKEGILITHGTDTMAWAFAILRYGLYDLKTNIVITGAQLPLEGAFSPSDAIGNMLTSVKLLNMMVPPNIIQVFNDGVHIFNKNLNKVKKWSIDAFYGNSFGQLENEQLKIYEEDVYPLTKDNRLEKLYFVKMGGTIDSVQGREGLEATGDFTDKYISELGRTYFDTYETIRINPKDSSLFNPADWTNTLQEIEATGLSAADTAFDWNILIMLSNPLLTKGYYDHVSDYLLSNCSGAVILGYGAGNVNIFNAGITEGTKAYSKKFIKEYGSNEFEKQIRYSIIQFMEKVQHYNQQNPDDYKFLVMSSQVPIDNYDIDYQAGRIPLYYGALPSGDLSFPEAQIKLAYILGHKELIKNEALKNSLSYEQIVKSCFLSGVKFNKKSNLREFIRISNTECHCTLVVHQKNVFVKNRFEIGLAEIVRLLKNE